MEKCALGQHKDEFMRGDKRVKCTRCDDTFPCAYACEHIDCCSVRQDALPEWVTCEGEPLSILDIQRGVVMRRRIYVDHETGPEDAIVRVFRDAVRSE